MGVPSGDEEAGGSSGHSAALSLGQILDLPSAAATFFAKDTNERYPDCKKVKVQTENKISAKRTQAVASMTHDCSS